MKWYHNDYSEEALAEMQKEAERRIEESRERARLLANAAFPQAAFPRAAAPPAEPLRKQPQQSGAPPCSNPCSPQNACPQPCSNASQNPFSALSEMLGGFGGDKLVLLGVLWLLWNEHADVKLLLALIYIML